MLIKEYDDFLFDGYKILRFKDLTEVRYNDIDQFAKQILIKEGLNGEDENPSIKNLENWKNVFLELKEVDKKFIIELEDYEGDGLSFFIGKIIEVNNDSISFHKFNAIGEWDEKPEEIFYKDISLVGFDDRYSRIISKYVMQK